MKPRRRPAPDELLGRPLPPQLRGWRLQLKTRGEVLREVQSFLEAELAEGRLDRAADSCDALVAACIEARDLTRQDGVKSLLGRALADAGVHEVDPAGQQFDPTRHRAVMSEPAPQGQDGIVAETLRVGYATSDGQTVRLPDVAVFGEAGK